MTEVNKPSYTKKDKTNAKKHLKTGLKVAAITVLITSEFFKAMKTIRWG